MPNPRRTQPRQRIEISFTDVEWEALVELVKSPAVKDAIGGRLVASEGGRPRDLGWTRKVMNTIERADLDLQAAKMKQPQTLTHKVRGST